MRHQVRRCLAAFVAIAMAFTMFPASFVQAAEPGEGASVEITQDINSSKYVIAGSESKKVGTDGCNSYLVGTNASSAEGTEKAAASVEGETTKGNKLIGSARVAAMAFDLPQGMDAATVSKATVTVTIFDGNDQLDGGAETKAALFQVAADKYEGLANDTAQNAPGATFPAKDGYAKGKTVFGDAWISYHKYQAQDQKVTFDVTNWVKESLANGDAHAIYRLQTVTGGFFAYADGNLAPKLSITAPVPVSEAIAQTLAGISLPRIASGDIALPAAGAGNAQITWTCREEDKAYVTIADGKAVVTRPTDADKAVQLTATATLGGVSDSKVFDVTIAKVQGSMPEPMASFNFDTEAQDGKFTSGDVVAELAGEKKAALQDRDTENGKALYLDGSASWLSLKKADGTSLLTGLEDVTISFDARPDRTATNWGFYAAPNENKQNGVETYIGALINNGKTTIERYCNGRFPNPSLPSGTGWSHVDVVFTERDTAIYINGEISVTASSVSLSKILGDKSIFQIGKANWGDNGEYYKGWIDNFKVYGQAVDAGQFCAPEVLDKMVQNDKEKLALNLTDLRADADFALPIKGEKGADIAWASSEEGVIAIEGGKAVVTRPADADKIVTLTAAISYGGVVDTKEFQVTVVKEMPNAEVVAKAVEKLQAFPNKDDIRENVCLPVEVEVEGTVKKAAVAWTSSNPNVVTAAPSADGKKAAGMVNRPEAGQSDAQVTLTAAVSCGDKSQQAEIALTVKAKKQQEKNTSYLFAHFTGTEGSRTDEQIYFATSEDGSQWIDMTANGSPALDASNIEGGDGGVRDPFLLRSHDGDKFYLIATDLSINRRGGWGNAQATTTGSTKLVIWESTDLVNWDEPRLVDVASKLPDVGMAWAPEAYYDPETGNYVVYWASKSSWNEIGAQVNMYYATTRDFYTFTDPVLWIDRDHDIIDTTMIYDDTTQTYYRASGDGQITIEKSKSIYDGWEIIGTLSGIFNNDKYSGAKLEGPEFFEYCEDDWLKDANGNPVRTWGLMCDQYAEGKGYLPFRSTDLADMSTKSWSAATDVNFGALKKRHGTILPISDAEYKAVMKKFGYGDDDTEEKVLVDFDFDTEADLGNGAKGFASENAKATGSYALKGSWSEEAKKALYLDGSDANFLAVTDKEGKSLLAGVSEMTISYEFKPDRSDTNWVMYAAPNSNAPTYNSEKYLGILAKDGSTTLERYNNSGSRPSNPSVQTGSDWNRVDIVIAKTSTTVYLNGEKKATTASSYQIPAILGNSGILQIGKANWGGGEYCKGWIDNFRITNKASSEAQIKELAASFVNTLPAVSAAVVGTAPTRDEALEYRGTDNHTAITSLLDREKKEIQPYVRKNADITKLPVKFDLVGNVTIKVNGQAVENGAQMNLSSDTQVVMERGGKAETWTVKKPIVSNNPVLPGQYADPDIDYFDGKFWIYPTTDGYPSWSGTVFHAFSSSDMVNWTDEGVILKLADQTPETNEQGVQIATSPWAVKGSAWAPTIEEKNGKYYFYYCGKDNNGTSAIGVAVADNPAGPYKDKGSALMTVAMCKAVGVSMGQAIDPSIFTDDNGKSYILFGNGSAAIAELTDDMMGIKEGTLKQIKGLTDFRESVIVTKKDGKYHWTWTCDDANSPNYHVNYGVSDTLLQADGSASVTLKKKNLLSKDESKNILGSGHQSVLHVQDASGKERYFMAYHRFYTPLNIFTSGDGLGKHRETCIDEITFDDKGEMVIAPTLEGVSAVAMPANGEIKASYVTLDKKEIALAPNAAETLAAVVGPYHTTNKSVTWESSNANIASVDATGKVTAKAAGTAMITVKTANGKTDTCTVTVTAKQPTGVTLNKTTLSLDKGASETLTATIAPADVDADQKALTWSSSDANIASVDNNGTVTAKATGTATITVKTVNGKTAACTVTVIGGVQPVKVTSVTLDKASLSLTVGKSQQLTATIAPANATNKGLSWKSNDTKIAEVDAAGKVTAKKAGTATITVTSADGPTATCKVTVKAAAIAVKKVSIGKTKLTLGVKEKFALKATVSPSNATSKKVTWKSDKKSVATVSSKGVVTAKKAGTAKVTATAGGKKATCKITVKKAPSKITLKETKKTIKKGKTYQLKVKLPKNTASNKITYTTSNKKVATVSASGKVKGVKKGKATITAKTFNGKKARVKITVK